jgi:subtilase family serine protease
MNRLSLRALAALAVGAMIVAACGGGGGGAAGAPGGAGSVIPQPVGQPNVAAPTSFAWGSAMVSKLPYVGPAKGGGLSLAVMVHMQNAAGLVQYAQSASMPGSANYRHWLTPQQIGQEFGASSSDYQKVASYFAGFGLKVGEWPQREMLSVSGSMQQFAKAFGTSFGVYTFKGKQIIAPTGTPRFASMLPVDSVVGLMTGTVARTFFIKNTNASYYGYSPQQLQQGFDFTGAYSSGFNGSGMHVGIIGTGPIIGSSGQDADTAALASLWHASVGSVQQVAAQPQPASTANGGTGSGTVVNGNSADNDPSGLSAPPPATAPCQQTNAMYPNYAACNPEDGEAQLDTESTTSLAPGATTLFYLAYNPVEYCYNPTSGTYDPPGNVTCPSGDNAIQAEGIQLTDDEIQQAIADDTADTISMSFGEPENIASYFGYITSTGSPGLGQIEMASMVSEGMAVFASSGDDGAWECFDPVTGAPTGAPCVNYPASDTNVVAVGGVNIPLDEAGNLTSAITAWADNTTNGGNGTFGNNVGSGGGVSTVFTPPPWQAATIANQPGYANMRELPDISLDADPNTGPSIAINSAFSGYQQLSAIGGTSAAAPEAAAQWAVVLQACKASATCSSGGSGPYSYRLGNPAPLFYAIYGTSSLASGPYKPGSFTPQLTYSQVFDDVIYGDNQAVPKPTTGPTPSAGYNSGPGYDEVTGLGAPFTGHLITAVTGTKVP